MVATWKTKYVDNMDAIINKLSIFRISVSLHITMPSRLNCVQFSVPFENRLMRILHQSFLRNCRSTENMFLAKRWDVGLGVLGRVGV